MSYEDKTKQELINQKYFLSKAQELGKIGSWSFDINKNEIIWSEENYRIFGLPIGIKFDYETFLGRVHPEDRDSVDKKWKTAVIDKQPYDINHRIITGGEIKWVREKAELEFDEQGSCVKAMGFTQDITERKKTEQALLNETLLNEKYINSLPGLFYVFDENRFVRWNSRWEDVTGYSNDELGAKYALDFFEGEDKALIAEKMRQVFTEGYAECEAQLVTKQGERIPYSFTGSRKEIDGIVYLVGLGIDITERRKAEREVVIVKNRFKEFFDNMISCGAIYSAVDNGEDFVFMDFNKAGQSVEKIDKQDVIGRRVTEVFPGVKDFGLLDVLRRVWQTGKAENFPIKEYKDERIHGWRENHVYMLNSGELVVIYDDVTEKKKIEEKEKVLIAEHTEARVAKEKAFELLNAYQELKDTQLQLIQTEKLAGIGQLGAGIAHELNSPLTGVLSLLRSYKREKDPQGEEYADLVEMEKACVHMADIIKNLNVFARQTTGDLELVDCNEAVQATMAFSGYHFKDEGIKLEKNYEKNLYPVLANQNQIQQVIVNMITNACDAMPEKGIFTITTKNITKEGNKWVEMEFADTGCGINQENIKKIFDPFFTTKRLGGGVGLGLSIVHKIVDNLKGTIKVNSEEGRGTVFTVRLPVEGEVDNG